jgi:ribosome biogenesis GTPase A
MVKAKNEIKENLKLVDLIIEIIDARIPLSSQNPEFNEMIGNKAKIIALNKSDMADASVNKEWVRYFKSHGIKAVLINSVDGTGIRELISTAFDMMKEKLEASASKGRVGRTVKAMVIGIPNAGKSSFINKVSKKSAATVGNKPGVTKKKQWISTDFGIELMDTPGILWPKFENDKVAFSLAFTGAIKYEILDNTELVLKLIENLKGIYLKELTGRYKLKDMEDSNSIEIFEAIAKNRGCIIKGGEIDYERAADIIIDEFRKGIIGRISLERPL